MDYSSRIFYEIAKKTLKKGEEVLSDPAFEAVAESWNDYFEETEIDTNDFLNLLADEKVERELQNFEENGTFDLEVIAERIEVLWADYNPDGYIDGLQVAEEIIYGAEPKMPGETQQKIQTRLIRRVLELKEESVESSEPLSLQDDLNYNKNEIIYGNLFQLENLPNKIFYGETGFRKLEDVYSKYSQEVPPFILNDGKIYSFANLEGTELKNAIKGDINSIKLEAWIEDSDKKYNLVYLMNRYLQEYLWDLDLRPRSNRNYFYPSDKKEVDIQWNFEKMKSRRWLVKYEGGYYIHRSLEIWFMYFGEEIYLAMQPRTCLSSDGYHDVDQKTKNRVTSKGQNFNRNKQELTDLRFWINFIAREDEVLSLGNGLKIKTSPISRKANFRLEEDYKEPDDLFLTSEIKIEKSEVNMN